jgi:hypothetical protein
VTPLWFWEEIQQVVAMDNLLATALMRLRVEHDKRRIKMRKSRITFDIETAKVKTIVDLLIDQVSNFAVSEIAEVEGSNSHKQPTPKSWEWAKPVAVSVASAMRQHADRDWYYLDPVFAKVAKEHGLSPVSMSQVLSFMVAAGRVRRAKRGHYRLVSV